MGKVMIQTFTVSGKAPFNPATQVDLRLVSPTVLIRNKSGITRFISVGVPGAPQRTVGAGEAVSVYGHIAPLYVDLQPDWWEYVDAPAPAVNPAQAAIDAHAAEVAAAAADVKEAEENLEAAQAAEQKEQA
jgi:hypothetical protein